MFHAGFLSRIIGNVGRDLFELARVQDGGQPTILRRINDFQTCSSHYSKQDSQPLSCHDGRTDDILIAIAEVAIVKKYGAVLKYGMEL